MCVICDLSAAMRHHAQEHEEATRSLRERLEALAREMQPASEAARRYVDKMVRPCCDGRQAA